MSEPAPDEQFPTAKVVDVEHPARTAGRLTSRVWNVTALCFVVAILLVWAGMYTPGTQVKIAFADGSGLEPGDKVRYRGIDVGEVVAVVLDEDLQHVTVTAALAEEAISLAREGTRFWVERPDIRIGQVRGLETLVGGRYVGVLPGPKSGSRTYNFEGLSEPPASIEELADGLELVLESPQRFGLQRGSPVNYRGVEVGHVISVGLANDSSNVIARTYIRPEYRSLVRDNSQFWSTSGIGLRFGIQGFELDAETLATIAAGGVALATPDSPGQRVGTGHRFELAKSARDEWLRWQPHLAIGSASLPDDFVFPQPTLGVSSSQGTLAVLGLNRRRGWLLALESGSVLGPANLLTLDEDGGDRTLEVWGQSIPLTKDGVAVVDGLALRAIPPDNFKAEHPWPIAKIHFGANLSKDFPEVIVTCGSDNLTMPLTADRLTAEDGHWRVDPGFPLDETWHGACVMSAKEGKLLGLVLQGDEAMLVVPISRELMKPASR